MKKIILIGSIIMSTLVFGDKASDVLEDRIENILEYKYRVISDGKDKIKVKDYDVDIFQDYINVEVEIGNVSKGFNFDKAFVAIKDEINKEMGKTMNINVIVELDKVIGEDEIIYNEKF